MLLSFNIFVGNVINHSSLANKSSVVISVASRAHDPQHDPDIVVYAASYVVSVIIEREVI